MENKWQPGTWLSTEKEQDGRSFSKEFTSKEEEDADEDSFKKSKQESDTQHEEDGELQGCTRL